MTHSAFNGIQTLKTNRVNVYFNFRVTGIYHMHQPLKKDMLNATTVQKIFARDKPLKSAKVSFSPRTF